MIIMNRKEYSISYIPECNFGSSFHICLNAVGSLSAGVDTSLKINGFIKCTLSVIAFDVEVKNDRVHM